jgi:hypothetical protein
MKSTAGFFDGLCVGVSKSYGKKPVRNQIVRCDLNNRVGVRLGGE